MSLDITMVIAGHNHKCDTTTAKKRASIAGVIRAIVTKRTGSVTETGNLQLVCK